MRGKIDTLIFTADSVKANSTNGRGTGNSVSFTSPQSDTQGISKDVAEKEIESEVPVENVERPVDLYKVTPIFMLIVYSLSELGACKVFREQLSFFTYEIVTPLQSEEHL